MAHSLVSYAGLHIASASSKLRGWFLVQPSKFRVNESIGECEGGLFFILLGQGLYLNLRVFLFRAEVS
jgi:hypothetical protein